MAHSRSAKKRVRQNESRRGLNRWRKRGIKDVVKSLDDALTAGKTDDASKAYAVTEKTLDRNASKKVLHKNTAARRKSRLAKRLNALKAKAGA